MSFFQRDLRREKLLSKFLDVAYDKLNLNFERIHCLTLQNQGVDLKYNHKGTDYYIDEKAQLDYINKTLPTFTFELSYLKNGAERTGWILDKNKITTHYFLITGIYAFDKNDLNKGFEKVNILSVDRIKLLVFLDSIGLTFTKLKTYNKNIRAAEKSKRQTVINELHMKTQGSIFFSKQLNEKPINLQLRLQFLIEEGLAKVLWPI